MDMSTRQVPAREADRRTERPVRLENLIGRPGSLGLARRARAFAGRLTLALSFAGLRELATSSRLLPSTGSVSLGRVLPFRHLLLSLLFFYKWPSRFGTLAKLPDRSRSLEGFYLSLLTVCDRGNLPYRTNRTLG